MGKHSSGSVTAPPADNRKRGGRTSRFMSSDAFVFVALILMAANGVYLHVRAVSAAYVDPLCGVTLVLVLVLYLWYRVASYRGTFKIERFFLVAFILGGLVFLFAMPPGSVPDEIYHFKSAYKYSDWMAGLGPTTENLPMRACDAEFLWSESDGTVFGPFIGLARYDSLVAQFEWTTQNIAYVDVDPYSTLALASNLPQQRVPAALGIMLAKGLGLGSIPLFYLGRLFSLVYSAVLVYLAVRCAPVAKNMLMTVALLPMSLTLFASYSYDASIIALALLLTGLVLKAVYGEGRIKRSTLVWIFVVTALLAPCKAIYALVAFAVLAVPSERFGSKRSAWVFKVVLVLFACFMAVGFRLTVLSHFEGSALPGANTDGLDWRGEESGHFYTLSDLIADPVRTVGILLVTIDVYGDGYLSMLVGSTPGWLQGSLQMPWFVTIPLLGMLLLSVQRSDDDDAVLPAPHRIWYALLFLLGALAVAFSMLLGHTFNTEVVIAGVQGRYFLPFLPLLLLALRDGKLHLGRDMRGATVLIMIILGFAFAVRLVGFACTLV